MSNQKKTPARNAASSLHNRLLLCLELPQQAVQGAKGGVQQARALAAVQGGVLMLLAAEVGHSVGDRCNICCKRLLSRKGKTKGGFLK